VFIAPPSEEALRTRLVGRGTDPPEQVEARLRTAHEELARKEREMTQLEERLQRLTTQLQAANRELEAFSYSVSHDLRAPLRAIDGFSRLVVERHGDQLDPEARRLLDVVRSSTQTMGRLIDDLLARPRSTWRAWCRASSTSCGAPTPPGASTWLWNRCPRPRATRRSSGRPA
jgi:signal transduction histidine kinase